MKRKLKISKFPKEERTPKIRHSEGKRGLNIHINFNNRAIYTFISFIAILIVGISVFAFGTSTPSNFGHSAGELDLSSGVSGNAVFNGNIDVGGNAIVSGNVGIGVSNPQEKLEVSGNGLFNGPIKLGFNNSCTLEVEGALRYNSNLKCIEYCNSTDWKNLGGCI